MEQTNEGPLSTTKLLRNLCIKNHCNLSNAVYRECANFLFFTSWYEELLFNDDKHQSPKNEQPICKELQKILDMEQFDAFASFCCKRYLNNNNNECTHQFRQLKLDPKYSDDVKNALLNFRNNGVRTDGQLFAYIMIVYRFRNNMFHGTKGLINLENYIEAFQMMNCFLAELIEQIQIKQYKGFNEKGENNEHPNLR